MGRIIKGLYLRRNLNGRDAPFIHSRTLRMPCLFNNPQSFLKEKSAHSHLRLGDQHLDLLRHLQLHRLRHLELLRHLHLLEKAGGQPAQLHARGQPAWQQGGPRNNLHPAK
jgi:hypothetical protein